MSHRHTSTVEQIKRRQSSDAREAGEEISKRGGQEERRERKEEN
jgi:hypothetical protein